MEKLITAFIVLIFVFPICGLISFSNSEASSLEKISNWRAYAITVDKQGFIYIGLFESGYFVKLNPSGEPVWKKEVKKPSVAITYQEKIYLSSEQRLLGEIYQVSKDGDFYKIGWRNFHKPEGLAFDSQGNLYVAEQGTGIIWKLPKGDFKKWEIWTEGLYDCEGIGFDSDDRLYVAHHNQVSRVTNKGSYREADLFFSIEYPDALCVDKENNLIYVATEGSPTDIIQLKPNGEHRTVVKDIKDVYGMCVQYGDLYISTSDGIYVLRKKKKSKDRD